MTQGSQGKCLSRRSGCNWIAAFKPSFLGGHMFEPRLPTLSQRRHHRARGRIWPTAGHSHRVPASPNPLKPYCPATVRNSYLLSEPRNSQVYARHHCEDRSHPYPSWPKPARPVDRQQRSYRADHERAECGSGGPTVPPHLGCQKVHCGIGDIAGTVHTRKDDAKRRIDGKQRKPARPSYHIDEREPRAVGQGEATKYWSEPYDPKPMISFTT